MTIVAESQTPPDLYGSLVIAMLVFMSISIITGFGLLKERRLRIAAENAFRKLQTDRTDTTEDRNSVMFLQHRAMNDLQMAKLAAEVQILQAQLNHRTVDTDRLEAGKEAHELMVEKMRLEMDSLRLHIAEQRRRGEDWNSNDI